MCNTFKYVHNKQDNRLGLWRLNTMYLHFKNVADLVKIHASCN